MGVFDSLGKKVVASQDNARNGGCGLVAESTTNVCLVVNRAGSFLIAVGGVNGATGLLSLAAVMQ